VDSEVFWQKVEETTTENLRLMPRRKLREYRKYFDRAIIRMVHDDRWDMAQERKAAIGSEFERRGKRTQRLIAFVAAIAAVVISTVAVLQYRANKHASTPERPRASSTLSTPQQSPAVQPTTTPQTTGALPTPQPESNQLSPTPTVTPIKWPPPAP
jgi:cytochrome c-type biogenesis protein CcmH/NrfG